MTATSERRRAELWRRFVARRLAMAFGRHLVRRARPFPDPEKAAPDVDAPAFWVECAAGSVDASLVLLEAEADARGSGLWPLAVTKLPGGSPTVHMRLDDFTELLLEWWSAKERGNRPSLPAPWGGAA